jgi:hypothetical protein
VCQSHLLNIRLLVSVTQGGPNYQEKNVINFSLKIYCHAFLTNRMDKKDLEFALTWLGTERIHARCRLP